jgi:hypothetical protein
VTAQSTVVSTALMPAAADTYHTSHTHHEFLKLLPAIQTHARISFRHLPATDRAEAVAEATAAAFLNYESAQRRGKTHAVNQNMLATYAVRHVKDGRHVGGSRDGKRDVLSRKAQRAGGFKVYSLGGKHEQVYNCLSAPDQPVWRDHLLHDRRTPVPDQVAFRCDWSTFLAQQTDRVRQMIGLLAAGHRRCDVAEKFGITPSAITQRMDRVKREWKHFQDGGNGEGIRRTAAGAVCPA